MNPDRLWGRCGIKPLTFPFDIVKLLLSFIKQFFFTFAAHAVKLFYLSSLRFTNLNYLHNLFDILSRNLFDNSFAFVLRTLFPFDIAKVLPFCCVRKQFQKNFHYFVI